MLHVKSVSLFRKWIFCCFLICWVALSPETGWGRPIGRKSPDTLFADADVVCNAEATTVTITNKPVELGFFHHRLAVAHLKVLSVFKGSTGREIDVSYPVSSEGGVTPPIHIRMTAGNRYRLYLKHAGDREQYVSAANGEIDDWFAVEQLSAKEANNSPPLLRAEAVKIATKYVSDQRTPVEIDWVKTCAYPGDLCFGIRYLTWRVSFSRHQPDGLVEQEEKEEVVESGSQAAPIVTSTSAHSQAPKAEEPWDDGLQAEVFVSADGTLLDESWVSSSERIPVDQICEMHVGKLVRIIRKKSEDSVCFGKISSLDSKELHGEFRYKCSQARSYSLPLNEIASIQLLGPPAQRGGK
jgi:hypothetical protein